MIEPVNFRPVDVTAKIFRGGQPQSPVEWQFIASLGVTQVVKLNLDSEASDAEWLIQNPPGTITYCPIPWWQQIITEPDLTQILDLLEKLSAPGCPATYIHCEHGINRTGFLCALYRCNHQGWTPEQALAEWHNYGAIPVEQEGLEKAFADIKDEYFWD